MSLQHHIAILEYQFMVGSLRDLFIKPKKVWKESHKVLER